MRKGITPAGLAMVFIALSFLVFLVATRFGLDLVGPPIVDLMERLHDATGWFEGARVADR